MAKEKKKDKQSLKKDVWNSYSASEKKALEKLCLNYRNFLSQCKTERECVKEIIMQAEKYGYKDLNLVLNNKEFLHAGDKVYAVCMKKSVVLFNIGSEPLENGMALISSRTRCMKTAALHIWIRIITAALKNISGLPCRSPFTV